MKLRNHFAAFFLLLSLIPAWSDTLFVPDSGANSVLRIGPSGVPTTYATPVVGPVAVALDSNRNLYVANSDGSVTRFAPGSDAPVILAIGLGTLGGIAIGPDGFPYVSVPATRQILKVVGGPGTTLFATAAAATAPGSIVFDADGTLFVADPIGNRIFQVNSTGAVTLFSDDVTAPRAVAVDSTGDVIAADTAQGGRIVAFNPNGKTRDVASGLGDVQGLTSDRDGNFFLTLSNGTVIKVTSSKQVAVFASGLTAPRQLASARPQVRVIATQGQSLVSSGGVQLAKLGIPATDGPSAVTFQAKLAENISGVAASNSKVVALAASAAEPMIIARQSFPAPVSAGVAPTAGALFSSFSDPVVNAAGRVAFRAILAGSEVSAATASGIWLYQNGQLAIVARQGAEASGAGSGVVFASFTQVALPNNEEVLFIAKLTGAGVASGNNQGLWRATPGGALQLIVRKGVTNVSVNGATKTVKNFKLLTASPLVGTVTRSFNAMGSVAFLATFTDGSKAVCTSVTGNGTTTAIVSTGQAATEPASAVFGKLNVPAIGSGIKVAFRGKLLEGPAGVVKTNAGGIWTATSPVAQTLIARATFPAPGTLNAIWKGFSDPLTNADGEVAFNGKLIPGVGDANSTNASGIWSDLAGSLAPLVRQGTPAAGAGDSFFAKFSGFSLEKNHVVFLAKLVGNKVDLSNDTGLWVSEGPGALEMLLRTGDRITVGGTAKTIAKITAFKPLIVVTGQSRATAEDGSVCVLLKFDDSSTAILRIELI